MTKEGQFAKGWGTGAGSTKGGTESGWKLVKDDPDPRKRVWQLYQNGRPIKGKTKTGSLTIGGNLVELLKDPRPLGITSGGDEREEQPTAGTVQDTSRIGTPIRRFGPAAEAEVTDFYKRLDEDIELQGIDQESRNYSLWLQNKIANSTTENEKKRWTTQYFDLVGSDNADIISKEVGGDNNFIQPRTWENDPTQVSDQPSEGDFREMFDIPETEGGKVQQTIQDGKPLAEDEYQEWDTGMDVNKGVIGKIGDKNWTKDSDKNIGSTPWARKSLMDSPKLANQATWRLLEEEGYDLRGLGLSDKQDLARDYRLDRLNKTDKGMFFRNRFMRKK